MHIYTNKPGVKGEGEVKEKVYEQGMITVMQSDVCINNTKAHTGRCVDQRAGTERGPECGL